jgi:hypothetical protein
MCEDRHISALACFAWLKRDQMFLPPDIDGPEKLALRLYRENAASIAHRYPGSVHADADFRFEQVAVDDVDLVQVIKAAQCYQYQACEHPAWKGSDAHTITESIIGHAISHLPGYDGAIWGWPERSWGQLRG